jgi:membrane-bound serine protease (ClpP class)
MTMKILKAIIVLFLALTVPNELWAQEKKVLQLSIKDDIDPRMNRYIELGLEAANLGDYDLVVIEMDTYGGLVNDAKDIVERLLDFEKPVYVFINKDAASAGALISIACDSIYMAPGASIGAATVVMGQGEAAPDKYQSYMRSTMRSTAEEKGRDPAIAEAMVDQNIEIEGVTKAGEVVTFTTSEAITHGFCEGEVESIDEMLTKAGVAEYKIQEFEISTVEKIIALFLNPFVSGILIMIIVGGLWFELQSPGVGFPIMAAVTAAILYFIPYYLNGLAANWELVVFVLGIILIALELVAIPGFGVLGISGIILTVSSLILVMLGNDVFDFTLVPFDKIFVATATTLGAMVSSFILLFFAGVQLTHTQFFNRVALSSVQNRSEGYTAKFRKESLLGMEGTAYTVLRPSGRVQINDEIHDAYTRGEYILKDDPIVVISEEGTTLLVKKANPST